MSAVRGFVYRCVRAVMSEHLCARRLQSYTTVWSVRNASSEENKRTPLKKPKTPQGKFDETEQSNKEKEPLERFPEDINPITKEKGGPRGPEPTRYGDWERKGRCIDF